MPKEYRSETETVEEIKSNKLPALLNDKKRMAAIAQLSQSGEMEDLDAHRLYALLERLPPKESAQQEKPEQPQFASEMEIATKMVKLISTITTTPPESLKDVLLFQIGSNNQASS